MALSSQQPTHLDDVILVRLEEGDLAGADERDAREHVAACEACRRRLEAVAELRAALASPPEEDIPPLLAGRLSERFGARFGEGGGGGDRPARPRLAALIPAAAALAGALAATVLLLTVARGPLGSFPTGAPQATNIPKEAPEAERAAPALATPPTGAAGVSTPQTGAGGVPPGGEAKEAERPPGARTRLLLDDMAGPALPFPVFDPVAAPLDTRYLNSVVRHPGVRAAAITQGRRLGRFHTPLEGSRRDLVVAAGMAGASPADAATALAAAQRFWDFRPAGARPVSGRTGGGVPPTRDGTNSGYRTKVFLWLQPGVWGPPSTASWLVVGVQVDAHRTSYVLDAVVLDARGRVLESLELQEERGALRP